ncbi:no significant blast hit [Histoplasma capsulatum]|uniref:No significant blast hit n=2 Tax=Histoplasma TaxID=5036 RepID=A0A8A1M1B9_AJECA|nr:no significant blast hit [Histoplasma capsulatum]
MPHSTDTGNDHLSRLHTWHTDPIKLGEWERDDKELFNGKDRPGRSYLHRDMELRPLTHFPQGSCNLITPFRLVEARRWWCDPLLARIWSEKPGESTRGEG